MSKTVLHNNLFHLNIISFSSEDHTNALRCKILSCNLSMSIIVWVKDLGFFYLGSGFNQREFEYQREVTDNTPVGKC